MTAGYDGQIRIDTRIDEKGFNRGVKTMSHSMDKSLGGSLKRLGHSLHSVMALMGAAFMVSFVFSTIKKLVESFDWMSSSLSGKITELAGAWQLFKSAIANTVVTALAALSPFIITVIGWLTNLLTVISQIISALFGVQAGAQAAAGATGDLGDRTGKAGKAAKGALAPFDQLNVLQKEQGGGGGTAKPALPSLVVPPDMLAKIEEFKNKLLAFFAPLQAPFERLKAAILELGGNIWDGLKWVYENILVPFGLWIVTVIAPIALDILTGALGVLNSVIEALKPLGLWLWDNFLQPIAAWTGGVIVVVLTWLAKALGKISDWIDGHQTTFQNIVLFFLAFWAAAVLVSGAIVLVINVITTVTTVIGFFSAALAFLAANPIILVILAIAAVIAIIVLLIKNWDWVKEKAGEVWDWIVNKWKDAGDWFAGIGDRIMSVFSALWNNIFTTAALLLGDLLSIFSAQITAIQGVINGIIKFVTGVFKGDWELAWKGIVDVFTSIFEGIQGIAKGVVNTVIDLINGMIRAIAIGLNAIIGGLNSIKVTIPKWVPVFGGESWGMSIPTVTAPQIPRLATGAVIPPHAEFLAMLGDQRSGRNLEAPEGLIRQIIREEMGNLEGTFTFEFAGNLGALVRELKPHIAREHIRMGGNMITVKGRTA